MSMTVLLPEVGTRVRSRRDFVGVPKGTEGVIDEHYTICNRPGLMVAWDLPDRPLPAGYHIHDGRPACVCPYLRDGFNITEVGYLELLDS